MHYFLSSVEQEEMSEEGHWINALLKAKAALLSTFIKTSQSKFSFQKRKKSDELLMHFRVFREWPKHIKEIFKTQV